MHNTMKEATIKTPVKDLTAGETLDHRKIILLEDIQAKMELVLEKADSTEASLTAKIDETKNELGWRLAAVEKVVSEHSGQLQNIEKQLVDHGKQLVEINRHLTDHDKRFDAHDKRFDAHDKRFDAHDKRFDTIETKIGECLDDHETRIGVLETARL